MAIKSPRPAVLETDGGTPSLPTDCNPAAPRAAHPGRDRVPRSAPTSPDNSGNGRWDTVPTECRSWERTVGHRPYPPTATLRPPGPPTPVGTESLGPLPPHPTTQETDGGTPSLPGADPKQRTVAHRPYPPTATLRPLGPPTPVGTESLGPLPPHPAVLGTDGETPSLPGADP